MLLIDPHPLVKEEEAFTGGGSKRECVDCEWLNRTLAKCRRTTCLAADLIVLKEHLCVDVKSNFYLALMPSVSSCFLL